MYGDEQVRVVVMGDIDPFAEGDEHICISGQKHIEFAGFVELSLENPREGKRHFFFHGAALADRAGVDPAVTRIKHDNRLAPRLGALCLVERISAWSRLTALWRFADRDGVPSPVNELLWRDSDQINHKTRGVAGGCIL